MSRLMRRAVFGGLVATAVTVGLAPAGMAAMDEKPVVQRPATPAPVTMVVEFAIKDYDAWRPVFDAAEGERMAAGVSKARVFREAGQPDRMLVLFTVENRKKGIVWMRSAKVKEAWGAGGVVGEPMFRFIR
jgi:hypothetical protein